MIICLSDMGKLPRALGDNPGFEILGLGTNPGAWAATQALGRLPMSAVYSEF